MEQAQHFKENEITRDISTHLVMILTSSCVLPSCSLSHCSSRAVSSALESTLADADAITLPVRVAVSISFIIHAFVHLCPHSSDTLQTTTTESV